MINQIVEDLNVEVLVVPKIMDELPNADKLASTESEIADPHFDKLKFLSSIFEGKIV